MDGADAPFGDDVAKGVRAADPDALAAVYRALAQPLTAYLRAQVGDNQLAQDLVSETFADLVRGCRTIEGGPFQIRGWLYRAAHHNLLDHRRYRGRRPEDSVAEFPEQADVDAPDDLAIAGEDAEAVRALLHSLPPEQAQVLTLRFLAELSAPEVAAIMARTEGAVRALQHRATAAMARKLRNHAVPITASRAPEPVT